MTDISAIGPKEIIDYIIVVLVMASCWAWTIKIYVHMVYLNFHRFSIGLVYNNMQSMWK